MQPEVLAVTATKIFVAQAGGGPRPLEVTGTVVEAPLDGGTAPREVPEARTPQGTGILGVAVSGDVLYISASANGPTGMFGVFRVANPPVAIAGGSSISANRPDNGDGGAATAAALYGAQGIAFSSTGDLFVAEAGDSRIRLVRNGIISTYAGTGACSTGSAAPSGPAKTTALCNPGLVAVGRDGMIYAARRGSSWIVSIDPAGVITTIANDFPIAGLAVDTDGSVLAADARAGRIVRIDTTGSPNATTVLASSLGLIGGGLTVGTDGSIYFASSQTSPPTAADWRIFRLRPVSCSLTRDGASGGTLEACPGIGTVGTLVVLSGRGCNYPGSDATIVFGPGFGENSVPTGTFGGAQLPPIQVDASGAFRVEFAVPAELQPHQGAGGGQIAPGRYQFASKPASCVVPFTVLGR